MGDSASRKPQSLSRPVQSLLYYNLYDEDNESVTVIQQSGIIQEGKLQFAVTRRSYIETVKAKG